MNTRLDDLKHFYALLDQLTEKCGGPQLLAVSSRKSVLAGKGVYFFMEPGEHRSDSGQGLRVVRVGTHGLKAGSSTTLWSRLSQHKGSIGSGGGNHRGSIFRLLVGNALLDQGPSCPTWGVGSTAKGQTRLNELPVEVQVTSAIRAMPFLYLEVNDQNGPDSERGTIERGAIGLLSNYERVPLDAPSHDWLGQRSNRQRVRESGLWNQNHVDEMHAPGFLPMLDALIHRMKGRS